MISKQMYARLDNMKNDIQHEHDIIPWRQYSVTIAETWLAFCIATFSIGIYFSHLNDNITTYFFGGLLIALYLFVLIVCIKRLVNRLALPALMLMVPIAPLAVLLLVVSLIPIIQLFR
jgi:hypothetical protein